MKFRYLTFILILTTSIFAAVRPQMQAFNAGELSPLMRLRSDFSKYDSGCVTFQNMIPLSQGPAFRRPGLKYIESSEITEDIEDANVLDYGGYYTTQLAVYRFDTDFITQAYADAPSSGDLYNLDVDDLNGRVLVSNYQIAGAAIEPWYIWNRDLSTRETIAVECVPEWVGYGYSEWQDMYHFWTCFSNNGDYVYGVWRTTTLPPASVRNYTAKWDSRTGELIWSDWHNTQLTWAIACDADDNMFYAVAEGTPISGYYAAWRDKDNAEDEHEFSDSMDSVYRCLVDDDGGYVYYGGHCDPYGGGVYQYIWKYALPTYNETMEAWEYTAAAEAVAELGLEDEETLDRVFDLVMVDGSLFASTRYGVIYKLDSDLVEDSNVPIGSGNSLWHLFEGPDNAVCALYVSSSEMYIRRYDTDLNVLETIKTDYANGNPAYTWRANQGAIYSPEGGDSGDVEERASGGEGKVRLISFEYSMDDNYIIEMGNYYMRFYRNGGQVVDANDDAVGVTTVFSGTEIFDVQFVQLADTVFLVEPNDPPQKLTRSSHTDWTIEDFDIETGPFMDENITDVNMWASDTTGNITIDASDDVWTADHAGALWRIGHRVEATTITGILDANESSSEIDVYGDFTYSLQGIWEGTVALERSFDGGSNWVTVIPRYNKGSSIKEDFSDSELEEDVIYRITMSGYVSGTATYNFTVFAHTDYGVVRITGYVDPNEVRATVISDLSSTDATNKWAEGYWSDENGWPRTIEFHEFRIFFGGNEAYPQTIWASRTDDYNDMTVGLLDSHALIYTLPSQNPIQWMCSQDYLFMGTLGGVGRLGEKDTAMTPTTQPVYREQSPFGAAYMQAIKAGDSILYVERSKRKVREIVYNLERDRFIAPDLTILAEHITGDGIVDWAFQKRPDPTIWYIRDDGHFLSMTYNRLEHDVVGWGDHVTDGNALSVATIPSSNEDEVWFVIERTIDSNNVKYIEQMQPRDFGDQEDAFYIDCGLTYDSTAATSFSGWDHLESETVSILADGLVVDNNSISSGGFGLSTAASVVHAGLPYNSILETMPVVFTSNEGSTAAQRKNAAEVAMNFYETLGTQYGIEGDTTPVYFDADTTLQSGWADTRSFQHGLTDDLTIYLEQIQPLPLTLRSLIPKVTVMER